MEMMYKTDMVWKPNSNEVTIVSEGRPSLIVQPPAEFGGDETVWTPEDLALAAAQSCLILTLLYTTQQKKVKMLRCTSHAEAGMGLTSDGPRFNSATHIMDVWIANESDREKMQEAFNLAVKGYPVNTISNLSFSIKLNIHGFSFR